MRTFGRWVDPRVKVNLRLLFEPLCWVLDHVWYSVGGHGLESGERCCDRCSRWRRYSEWDGLQIGERRYVLARRRTP